MFKIKVEARAVITTTLASWNKSAIVGLGTNGKQEPDLLTGDESLLEQRAGDIRGH
jgi:hypothetical protein